MVPYDLKLWWAGEAIRRELGHRHPLRKRRLKFWWIAELIPISRLRKGDR